ncbi:MAG: hypothetical protein EOP67_14190, partial [Sphingomonas sp.]
MLLMVGQTGAEPPCRFKVPADLDAAPARWLGECGKGTAEGLGIMRAGTGEPYAFFAGRMKGGVPVHGLLMLRSGGAGGGLGIREDAVVLLGVEAVLRYGAQR